MSHLALRGSLAANSSAPMLFDDWQHRLSTICGRFSPQRHEKNNVVRGCFGLLDAGGIEVAHIANDLGEVERTATDIRRDYGENLFLLVQLEGSCGIEQKGRQSTIDPGDCILVDSSQPSRFHFGGRYSNHISVHMPRQILFSKANQALDVSRRLDADDPMAVMLGALVAKLVKTDASDKRAPHLRQLLFDTTRQAFATEDEHELLPRSDTAGARLEIIQVLIDRHLTEENLTPRWLADRLGISLRTLQDDFNEIGTTATSLIRMRRLYLAKEQLESSRVAGQRPNIAEVALSAGFNDISYFNRCFRQQFDCTPKDVLAD